MQPRHEQPVTIEGELRVPAATVRVVRTSLPDPVDRTLLDEDAYLFGLCLTPGPHVARACYRDRWSPRRFERLGGAFVLPPGEPVKVRSEYGRDTSLMCQVHVEPMRAWLDGDLEWSARQLEATFDIRNPKIRQLLQRLFEETRHPGFASPLLAELLAMQLAIELARHAQRISDGAVAGGLTSWRLRLIDERLEEVRDAPTLAELAGLCRLSVRQLTRSFRISRGCSIGDYVAQSQLDHARRLLAGDETVTLISQSLGFSSLSAFAHAFRRITGETPREYRQRIAAGA